jgi:hypothetical protein
LDERLLAAFGQNESIGTPISFASLPLNQTFGLKFIDQGNDSARKNVETFSQCLLAALLHGNNHPQQCLRDGASIIAQTEELRTKRGSCR